MKLHALTMLGTIGLGALLAAGLFAQSANSTTPTTRPIRWQHLALTHAPEQGDTDQDLARQIERLGGERWELVDVESVVKDGTTEETVFYFKRPR